MRKSTMVGAAVLAVATLLVSALPQDSALTKPPDKYAGRLQPLVGKQFALTQDGYAMQYPAGDLTLIAVGVDYAEFQSESEHRFVPLGVLHVMIETPKSAAK